MTFTKKYCTDDVLAFIKQYKEETQHSPSYQTIQTALGMASKSVVRFYLDRLKEEGRIRFIYSYGTKPKVVGYLIT